MTYRQPDPRTLTQMQRYGTAYEVAVTAAGVTTRLAFTGRRTKATLLAIAQANAEQLLDLGAYAAATYAKDSGWTFGAARVHFTGRTERDVANEMSLIA